MSRTSIAIFVSAVAVAAVLALIVPEGSRPWTCSRPDSLASGGDHSRPASALPAEAVLSVRTRGTASPVFHPSRALTPVMEEFAARRSWKPLFDRLRASTAPSPEERWVLSQMLDRCAIVTDRQRAASLVRITIGGDEALARFKSSLSEKDSNRDKRIAAFEALRVDPCVGLHDVRTTEGEIRGLVEEAAAQGDPKARAWVLRAQRVEAVAAPQVAGNPFESRSSMPDAKFEAYKQIMQSGDPYALEQAGFLFTASYADFSLRAGPEERPLDNEVFRNALALVACDMGKPCQPDPWACASQGQCDAHDVREHLLFYRSSPAQSQLMMEYYEALGRAVRDGDWSYFSVRRGPPPSEAMYTYQKVTPPPPDTRKP